MSMNRSCKKRCLSVLTTLSSVSLPFYSVSLSSTLSQSVSCPQTPPTHKKGQKAQAVCRRQTVNLPNTRAGFSGEGAIKRKNIIIYIYKKKSQERILINKNVACCWAKGWQAAAVSSSHAVMFEAPWPLFSCSRVSDTSDPETPCG